MSESTSIVDLDLVDLLKRPMMRKFAIAYASNGGNATQAAKTAGYKHPDKQGSRLLTKVGVQEAVRRHACCLVGNAGENRETIIDRERNWANSDIRNYFVRVAIMKDDGTPAINKITGDEIYTTEMKDITSLSKNVAQCIKKLSWNRNGPVLELHDPGRANRHLAEYSGMLQHKVSDMTPVEAAQAIHDAIKAMDEVDGTGEKSTAD